MSTEQQEAAEEPAPRRYPFTHKLGRPIEFAGETITALEFKRGKMGDLKGVKLDGVPPVDQLLMIASRLTGQPLKVIESLEDEDGAIALEIALDFFARCLGAGRKR